MTPRWPEDARCIVLVTVDADGTGNEVGLGLDPAGVGSVGGYTARRGVPRLLEVFRRQRIPATFFVPGYDAEMQPDLVQSIVDAGHEVAAHGYLHESWELSPEEEEPLLRKAHAILTEQAGRPPLGWRSPGGRKTSRTLAVLAELGYRYDSSDKDFDAPYPAIVAGHPSTEMVEIPNITSTLDDAYMYRIGMLTAGEMLDLWCQEFDALYHSSGYVILTCHARSGYGSGLPARARTLERLIDFMKGYRGVHFSRMGELARWCLDPANGFLDPPHQTGGHL